MALDPSTCTGATYAAQGVNEICLAFKYWTQDQEALLGGKIDAIYDKLDTVLASLDDIEIGIATIDTDLNATTNVKLDTLHDDLLDVQTAISGISGGGGGGSVDVTGVETRLDTSNDLQQAIGEGIQSFGYLYLAVFGAFLFFAALWYIIKRYIYV